MLRVLPPVLTLALAACATTAAPARPAAVDAPPPDPALRSPYDPGMRAAPPRAPSPQVVALDAMQRLAPVAFTRRASPRPVACTGVPLAALLQAEGALPAAGVAAGDAERYVIVVGADGRRALFSLAELDPGLGARRVFVGTRCQGDARPGRRLVAADDRRPLRDIDTVVAVVVVAAP